MLSEAKALVLKQVDQMRDEILDLVSEVVRIPSVNPNFPGVRYEEHVGGETRVNRVLEQHMRAAGMETHWVEGAPERQNLVGVLRGSGGGRTLVFNGHVDTVPPVNPTEWKFGTPFSGRIADGKLYGLGATDMKSGVVAQLKAVEAIRRAGIQLGGSVVQQAVIGEEMMEHLIGTSLVTRAGFRGDAAVVAEPSSLWEPLMVIPVSPGLYYFRLTFTGKATHVGVRSEVIRPGGKDPSIGSNAVEKAIWVVQMIQKLEQDWSISKRHPLFTPGYFTIHPGLIKGDPGYDAPFMFATKCYVEFCALYPPQEADEDIQREIEEYVHNACQIDPWLREHPPKIEWLNHWPPFEVSVESPICNVVADAHELASGGPSPLNAGNIMNTRPRFRHFAALADAAFLQAEGIPAIVYGPGSLTLAHSKDEYVDVDEVIVATKTLALSCLEFCGVER